MRNILSFIPNRHTTLRQSCSDLRWFFVAVLYLIRISFLTCFRASCLLLFSSSYLSFHWLSSTSSFSMFLMSACLSLTETHDVSHAQHKSSSSSPNRPFSKGLVYWDAASGWFLQSQQRCVLHCISQVVKDTSVLTLPFLWEALKGLWFHLLSSGPFHACIVFHLDYDLLLSFFQQDFLGLIQT